MERIENIILQSEENKKIWIIFSEQSEEQSFLEFAKLSGIDDISAGSLIVFYLDVLYKYGINIDQLFEEPLDDYFGRCKYTVDDKEISKLFYEQDFYKKLKQCYGQWIKDIISNINELIIRRGYNKVEDVSISKTGNIKRLKKIADKVNEIIYNNISLENKIKELEERLGIEEIEKDKIFENITNQQNELNEITRRYDQIIKKNQVLKQEHENRIKILEEKRQSLLIEKEKLFNKKTELILLITTKREENAILRKKYESEKSKLYFKKEMTKFFDNITGNIAFLKKIIDGVKTGQAKDFSKLCRETLDRISDNENHIKVWSEEIKRIKERIKKIDTELDLIKKEFASERLRFEESTKEYNSIANIIEEKKKTIEDKIKKAREKENSINNIIKEINEIRKRLFTSQEVERLIELSNLLLCSSEILVKEVYDKIKIYIEENFRDQIDAINVLKLKIISLLYLVLLHSGKIENEYIYFLVEEGIEISKLDYDLLKGLLGKYFEIDYFTLKQNYEEYEDFNYDLLQQEKEENRNFENNEPSDYINELNDIGDLTKANRYEGEEEEKTSYLEFRDISVEERRIRLKESVEERKIEYLVHFTNLKNLKSIMTNGIIPVGYHDKYKISACINDSSRYDKCLDASSLSISFPNYRMFYKVRINNPSERWVIILLDPSIIWKKDCAFNRTNAANNQMSSTSLQYRKTIQAFNDMFGDEKLRKEIGLPSYFTTDPQAEVLVFDIIEPEYIRKIVVEKEEDREYILNTLSLNDEMVIVDVKYFRPRFDFNYWRGEDLIWL
ncbi:DarT ssDNA thymidine ADP-ribosyltransferase family protein [Caldicellulosiruptor changbaiensis]|nr:DarT ssDNA thymidine ADP-ribosyltransferase family protein [Caldicellulosiruptor changbaiensis]